MSLMPFEPHPDHHLLPHYWSPPWGGVEGEQRGHIPPVCRVPTVPDRAQTDLKDLFLGLAFVVPEKDLALELLTIHTAPLPIKF